MTPNLEPKKKPLSVLAILGIIAAVFICGCIGLLVLARFIPNTPNSTVAKNDPTTIVITLGSSPTALSVPTSRIQASTSTVEVPTVAPSATAPAATTVIQTVSYAEIQAKSEDLTGVQWRGYTEQTQGKYADKWVGWVSDVSDSGGYSVQVNMEGPGALSLDRVSFDTDKATATQLNKNQKIVFSGQIKTIMDLLGIRISLENVIIEGM